MKRLLTIATFCCVGVAVADCGRKEGSSIPTGEGDGNAAMSQAESAAGELSTVAGASIRPSASPEAGPILAGGGTSRRVLCENATLYEAICEWCPFGGQVLDENALPAGRFDISAEAPEPNQPVWPLVREAIEKAFAVRIRQARKEVDVHLLRKQEDAFLSMTCAEANAPRSWAVAKTPAGLGYRAKNASLDALAEILEEYAGTPVFNETGLEGGYDFELDMDHWKPETAFAAVEKLGLRLVPAKRPMEVLAIEKAATSAATSHNASGM